MPPIAPPPSELIEQMPAGLEGIGYVPEELNPYEPHYINTHASLYQRQEVEDFLGVRGEVPAIIEAADKRIFVVDIRGHDRDDDGFRNVKIGDYEHGLDADFLLICPDDWDEDGVERGFKGLRIGEPVTFGRANQKIRDRFDLSSNQVSANHFTITYDYGGELVIEDLDSTNGTSIIQSDHSVQAEQTVRGRDRVMHSGRYKEATKDSPYGSLDDDPIIGRRSPRIEGGVYLGGGAREAITVKPEQDQRIEAVYSSMSRKRVLRGLVQKALGIKKTPISQLETVYETVQSAMKYDGPAVEELSNQYKGDQKVSLGEYIEKGIGVCRHQGLLAAFLVERLIRDGRMEGQVRIERNTIPEYGGAHAWATYIDSSGKEYVIDAAQNFVGTKKEARAKSKRWDYYLPLQ